MRQVKRLTRSAQVARRRRRPPPPWLRLTRRIALAALAVAAVVGGGYVVVRAGLAETWAGAAQHRLIAASAAAGFVVRNVYSEGRALADEDALVRVLQPIQHRPIFTVELDEIKKQVEALPWVRSASVGRRLPDTIWVRIEEHRPIARWMDGTQQVLVSDAQEVFEVRNAGRYRELPLLFGKDAPAHAAEILDLVATQPGLAQHVTGARLVGQRRWDVYLDARIEVRLPAERPEAAWHRLAAEQDASDVLSRAVVAIDLRNPDWLTLELPDEALGPSKEPRA